jgi:ketosteroid isomerase-like protein
MQVRSSAETLDEVIERYHAALDPFLRGEPEPMKALFSHQDDVVLANPFGPAGRGWEAVSERLEHASSRFRGGKLEGAERLASYVAADLATIFVVERGTVSVGGGPVSGWVLRTTTTFRHEDGAWKVVHRHADPINTDNDEGPLRTT